jgi:OFA family oxalate/formate antiporter-like MFS transporter
LAGLAGPIIIAYVKDSTGSYTGTLYVFVGLFFVALIASVLMLANIKKIKTGQATA